MAFQMSAINFDSPKTIQEGFFAPKNNVCMYALGKNNVAV